MMNRIYRFFTSIQLTLVLTYIIVALTMAGSFTLFSGKEAFESIDAAPLIEWLSKSSFAYSWWIIILVACLFLFSLNTFFCTWERVAQLFRSKRGLRPKLSEDEETFVSDDISKGRGVRLRTLLPYLAHAGFLLALAGHLAGSIWGFRGADFALPVGEKVPVKEAPLFSVLVKSAEMEIGRRGYPEKMSARVVLYKDGKELEEKDVEINRPLLHGNMAVYIKNVQEEFKGLELEIKGQRFILNSGERRPLNGNLSIYGGRIDNRYGAMELILVESGQVRGRKWLMANNPGYSSFDTGEGDLRVLSAASGKIAVLSVNMDQGVWIVFAGLSIFVVSLVFHLFLRKKR